MDWDKTRAFSMGLCCIFLNVKGREANGILNEAETESVRAGIVSGLAGFVDPDCGQVAVRSVARREQVYTGPYAGEAPDLIVNFSEGYRVSWDTPLGGVPQGLFADNTKKWGGDHVIDPALASGILFMNRKFSAGSPGLVDLAPTILNALGVATSWLLPAWNASLGIKYFKEFSNKSTFQGYSLQFSGFISF